MVKKTGNKRQEHNRNDAIDGIGGLGEEVSQFEGGNGWNVIGTFKEILEPIFHAVS